MSEMIQFDPRTRQFSCAHYKATFVQFDNTLYRYGNDEGELVSYINKWWHMTLLRLDDVSLTEAQQARLDLLNTLDITTINRPSDYMVFVRDDGVDPNTPESALRELSTPERTENYVEALKAVVRLQCADRRYVVETGGMDYDGESLLTTREVQSRLDTAYLPLYTGVVTSIAFKYPLADGRDEYREMDLEAMTPLYTAMVEHVQHCYAIEKQVVDELINPETEMDKVMMLSGNLLFDHLYFGTPLRDDPDSVDSDGTA